jgi:hypothetical protein
MPEIQFVANNGGMLQAILGAREGDGGDGSDGIRLGFFFFVVVVVVVFVVFVVCHCCCFYLLSFLLC